MTDKEEGHTPLHDCLQQVYFETVTSEENCEKFQNIWDAVVEKAVTWWCQKRNKSEPAIGSKKYLEIQRKAVYYLRYCIPKKNGLSVQQFAADRGLVTCVQAMLSMKGVFVMEAKTKRMNETVHEIDVTNLCPEFFVKRGDLYSSQELSSIEKTNNANKKKKEEKDDKKRNQQNQEAEHNDKSREK